MTKAQRDALRALEAKATPGVWPNGNWTLLIGDYVLEPFRADGEIHGPYAASGLAFIAAARNNLVALLDALDNAEAVIEAARKWKQSPFAAGGFIRALEAYDAKHDGGAPVAPSRPAPTTVPSSGMPRQDKGR